MKELKQIKNKFDNDTWKEYKNKFKHKSMRFIISYIILLYRPSMPIDDLVTIEKQLISKNKNIKMFDDAFIEVKKITKKDFNWESLSKFMWYAYQTSTYYKDIKKGITNIYTLDNFIEINAIKIKLFSEWLTSIPVTEEKYNFNIRSFMSKVF